MTDPARVRPAVRIEHEEGEDGVEIPQVAEAGARGRVRDRAAVDRAEDKCFIHEAIDAVAAQERVDVDAVGGVELAEGDDEIGSQELLDLHVGQGRGASRRLGKLEGEVGRDQGADVVVDALSETALSVEVDEQALPADELLGLDGPEVVELESVGEGLAESAAGHSLVELREVRAEIDPLVEQGVARAEPVPREAVRRGRRRWALGLVGRCRRCPAGQVRVRPSGRRRSRTGLETRPGQSGDDDGVLRLPRVGERMRRPRTPGTRATHPHLWQPTLLMGASSIPSGHRSGMGPPTRSMTRTDRELAIRSALWFRARSRLYRKYRQKRRRTRASRDGNRASLDHQDNVSSPIV